MAYSSPDWIRRPYSWFELLVASVLGLFAFEVVYPSYSQLFLALQNLVMSGLSGGGELSCSFRTISSACELVQFTTASAPACRDWTRYRARKLTGVARIEGTARGGCALLSLSKVLIGYNLMEVSGGFSSANTGKMSFSGNRRKTFIRRDPSIEPQVARSLKP
uniref:Uncharacterized protein n=1 Tax=Coccidioides posadasii RMSCC 3488 TaxID=454284 RepID=A0A0J6FGF5_COCPO|nr:hypothetical protein CPAG_08504 [Coccidioides posadasii RMSCC 3488]